MSGYISAEEATSYAQAGSDFIEEDVEGVFGGKVRIRSLSAAAQARVKQATIQMGRKTTLDFGTAEQIQFAEGVVEPKFSLDQVKLLQLKSGPSFTKVIERIDEISGMNKEKLAEDEAAFPEPGGDE